MSNTHIAMAKFRQEGVHEWQSREGETGESCIAAILDAQVEATLALAYEARTANLIALSQTPNLENHDGSIWGVTNEFRSTLFNEASRRMELSKLAKP